MKLDDKQEIQTTETANTFLDYYLAHRDEILCKLRIRKKVIRNEDGSCASISDVELI